jgi:hypothetical protein
MAHTQKRKQRKEDAIVIGVDSETLQGPPITFQFFSEEARAITGCVFIGKRSPLSVFLAQLGKLKAGTYRMYGHNLEFDMLSFLWDVRAKIRDGNISISVGRWKITGRYSKPIFAVFEDGNRHIEVVDSFLWFMSSLERAAERVCPDLPKYPRPKNLGMQLYTPKDTGFVKYAMRDAEIAYYVGKAIEKYHADLEVPPQISLASMAAAVFRLKYMQENIYQPPVYQWMAGAAASYHGGVNRIRPGCEMTWHQPVTALDLSSAYPHAWTELPELSSPNGYKAFRARTVRGLKHVPDCGIYQISGVAAPCDWPALFNHDFDPLQGKFADTWVTGWELNEALRVGEVKLKQIGGYFYDRDKDVHKGYSPFAAFAEDFYKKKNEEPDKVTRYMHKITLNAPTGKLIQTSPDFTLADGKLIKIRRAGGLYQPFAASLTTGHTRARIHAAEHKYKAIHTATDGIFVPGVQKGAKDKVLGALVAEGVGDLALFRNKLYILYTHTESDDTFPSQVFKGRHILKVARHGFQGRVVDLERMLITADRTYSVNKPLKLKTALRKNAAPNKFVKTTRKINIGVEFKVRRYG